MHCVLLNKKRRFLLGQEDMSFLSKKKTCLQQGDMSSFSTWRHVFLLKQEDMSKYKSLFEHSWRSKVWGWQRQCASSRTKKQWWKCKLEELYANFVSPKCTKALVSMWARRKDHATNNETGTRQAIEYFVLEPKNTHVCTIRTWTRN